MLAHAEPPAPSAPRGLLITFEGGDGAGKTTHIGLLAEELQAAGREVVRLREPGGTAVGEQLRGVVLDVANAGLAPETELLIYEAARAQLVSEMVEPALRRGAVVLCDRFCDSTLAYQGFGRGLDRAFVERASEFACKGLRPDRTILLVAGGATSGLARATAVRQADRMEGAGEPFQQRVLDGFLQIARKEPDRVRTVRSDGDVHATAAAIRAELADLFPELAADAPAGRAAPAARVLEGE